MLLHGYLEDLLSRLTGRTIGFKDIEQYPLLPSTEAFIAEQRELYTVSSRNNPRRIIGALLAQEWLAYSMLTRLYEGARNYQHLYPSNDCFHEHCEYFYVHIGDAEKEHKIQAVEAAVQQCKNQEDLEELRCAFFHFLEITAQYWNGIAAAMGRAA